MSALDELRKRLRAGKVYRRKDLAPWSTSIDRHLKQLVEEGTLQKASGGLYMAPKTTRFGPTPAEADVLVQRFLGDARFLLVSPNAYNGLGVGTTQLYNAPVVYNRKRHGRFELAGRPFEFRQRASFPRELSEEFLLVDVLHNADRLAEDAGEVRQRALAKAQHMDRRRLAKAVEAFDSARVRSLLAPVLAPDSGRAAA
jgi:hypothetical protein